LRLDDVLASSEVEIATIERSRKMKSATVWILAAVNALLLVTFVSRHMGDNNAMAQVTRRPPEYVMIPGEISGVSSEVIFVVDTANGELGGFSYDNNTLRLDAMSTVDIGRIFEQAANGAATPARNNSVPGTGASGTMRK
jgi:hypothetical protein